MREQIKVEEEKSRRAINLDLENHGTRTVCPGSSYPFCIVTHSIKWVTTSWTHSITGCNGIA
mgnify:CR=1 FL=1